MYLVFMIPIVALVAVFTFVAVASWSDNRRKEREAYYRHELYQKMLGESGGSAEAVVDLLREEERRRQRQRIDGLRLGGLITLVSGLGLGVFLFYFEHGSALYLVSLIPFLVGLVLTFYGFVLAPRAAVGSSAGG